jgi:glutamate-1-semialdehyde 2,1-aminomutase
VYQAGTLSGNPLATAAGLAVFGLLDEEAYRRLVATAAQLGRVLLDAIGGAGVPVQVPVVGPLVGVFFADSPVTDYDGARRSAHNGAYAAFFRAMLERGIALAPGPYEVMFPSLAHTPDDIARTGELASAAAAMAATAL